MNLELIEEVKEYTKKMNVLYVEDDPDIRNEVIRLLTKVFMSVDVAEDGQNGLELYNKAKYDIVMTDIEMPAMDGIEMIKQIKAISMDQIVAVLSAYDNPKYLKQLIEHGVDMFIMKPFDINAFFQTIHKLIKDKHYKNKVEALEKQINEQLDIEKMLLYSTMNDDEKKRY